MIMPTKPTANKAIYKYPLELKPDAQEIELPMGAKILSVANQREQICVWAHVNPDVKETQTFQFKIFGTGHPCELPANAQFLGTVLIAGGSFIWHIFFVEKLSE